MRKMKKIVALMLVTLLLGSMVGCNKKSGANGGGNGGKEVTVAYWHAGEGIEWLNSYVDAFNESQSEWYVKLNASTSQEGLIAPFGQADIDETDLYMTGGIYKEEYLEPLEDILEETVEGDLKPLKDKVNKEWLRLATHADGHLYHISIKMPANGIVYNKALFEEARIEVTPRTTNELAIVADKLVQKGHYAWTHFTGSAYYFFVRDIWSLQYDGADYYYNKFIKLEDEQGNSPSLEVLTKKDGRYEAIKALENILTPTNVLPGSNSYDHITAQTMFLTGNNIGMMVNGSWLANEMKSVGSTDGFEMMKTPVISSITDKLETVKSDQLLRELVSAIDEVTDGKTEESKYQSGDGYVVDGKQISTADWDYVKKARNTIYTTGAGEGYSIPNYAKEKEGAKEFLKFMVSDKGIRMATATSIFELSTGEAQELSHLGGYEMSVERLAATAEQYATSTAIGQAHPIFAEDMTDAYAYQKTFFHYFCAANSADRLSADQVWDKIVAEFNSKFDNWVKASK